VTLVFTVVVGFSTHDALKLGRVTTGHSTVVVAATTDTDATLVAASMVACRGLMPTSTTITDVVA
jgi:hypothetical protein